jgi:ankyrin repeat protein
MRSSMKKLLESVLSREDADVKRLLRTVPDVVRARFEQDYLVKAIPHWLYVGDTALHLAAAALNPPAVQLFLNAGADPNTQNRRKAAPLHYACDARPMSAGVWNPSSQARIIELLLQHKADLEHVDRGGVTALHRAVRARSPAAVQGLLKGGARVDVRLGKGGSTALHLAVQSTGAGGTAGAVAEQLDIVTLLLEHGADPKALDANGKSVYDRAGNDRIRRALERKPSQTKRR